jgi:hypothetical protein
MTEAKLYAVRQLFVFAQKDNVDDWEAKAFCIFVILIK